MADRKPPVAPVWPQILIDAIAKNRRSRRELATLLERDASLISLYCSGRSVPRLSDRKTIDNLAGFLGITVAHLENLILAFRPGAGGKGRSALRISTAADLQRAIANDLSGVLRSLWERRAGETLAGRLRELNYEVPEDPNEWASVVSAVGLAPARSATSAQSKLRGIADAICRTAPEGAENDPVLLSAIANYGRINECDLAIRDSVRSACRVLDEMFTAANNEIDEETVFEALLGRLGWCTDPETKRIHAHALYRTLIAVRYLERIPTGAVPNVNPVRVKRRWRLSASFVVNWLFGYSLDVRRFDFLLDGGLLLPGEHGLAILATGRPGAGKTTLILQVAASLSAEGFVGVFLSAEEHTSSLLDKLSYIGYQRVPPDEMPRQPRAIPMERERLESRVRGEREPRPRRLNVICTDDLPDADVLPVDRDDFLARPSGCLILTMVADRRNFIQQTGDGPENSRGQNPKLLTALSHLLAACRERERRSVVVIDSLESLTPIHRKPEGERRMVEALFNFARNNATITLIAGEKSRDDDAPSFAEYLTDMHIHLGFAEGTGSTRALSIVKSRHQSTVRGEHVYAILGGSGVDCYPSIRARLSVARRRIRPRAWPGKINWTIPASKSYAELNFDEILRGDVVNGDCVLLTGPSGTRKFLIGLSFLTSALTNEDGRDVLLISLRQDLTSVLRIIEAHPQFALMLKPVAPAAAGGRVLSDRVKLFNPPPDYFSAARFYEWMRDIFGGSTGKISRILIHTMDQFQSSSPLIRKEPMFFSLLIEYFKAHGATSMFVLNQGADETFLPRSDIFDAVLRTTIDQSGQVQFSVGHSGSSKAWGMRVPLTHENGELRLGPIASVTKSERAAVSGKRAGANGSSRPRSNKFSDRGRPSQNPRGPRENDRDP